MSSVLIDISDVAKQFAADFNASAVTYGGPAVQAGIPVNGQDLQTSVLAWLVNIGAYAVTVEEQLVTFVFPNGAPFTGQSACNHASAQDAHTCFMNNVYPNFVQAAQSVYVAWEMAGEPAPKASSSSLINVNGINQSPTDYLTVQSTADFQKTLANMLARYLRANSIAYVPVPQSDLAASITSWMGNLSAYDANLSVADRFANVSNLLTPIQDSLATTLNAYPQDPCSGLTQLAYRAVCYNASVVSYLPALSQAFQQHNPPSTIKPATAKTGAVTYHPPTAVVMQPGNFGAVVPGQTAPIMRKPSATGTTSTGTGTGTGTSTTTGTATTTEQPSSWLAPTLGLTAIAIAAGVGIWLLERNEKKQLAAAGAPASNPTGGDPAWGPRVKWSLVSDGEGGWLVKSTEPIHGVSDVRRVVYRRPRHIHHAYAARNGMSLTSEVFSSQGVLLFGKPPLAVDLDPHAEPVSTGYEPA